MKTKEKECVFCSKTLTFHDLKKYVVYRPYGNVFSTEPPPEEYIHFECWDKATKKRKDLIKRTSTRGPTVRDYK